MKKKKGVIVFAVVAVLLLGGIICYRYGSASFYNKKYIGSYCVLAEEKEENRRFDADAETCRKMNEYAALNPLGNYDKLEFKLHRTSDWVLESDWAATMVASYGTEEYQTRKEKLQSAMPYLKNQIGVQINGSDEIKKPFRETECDIGDWHFGVADSTHAYYPHNFQILGFNDEERKIAVLTFESARVETVDTTLNEFIRRYFKCNFERKWVGTL